MTEKAEAFRPRKKKVKVRSHRTVAITRVHPNDWNPNEMSPGFFKKLKAGIKRTLDEANEIPPIIVRPSSKEEGQFEIIDGFHRWKVLNELKQPTIGVFVLKVGDKTARILTRTLNYLKGSPNRGKYARGIVELIELGVSESELEEFLPEDSEELAQLWEEAEVTVKAAENLLGDNDGEDIEQDATDGNDDIWIDLKFRVSIGQAEVIERELARIGGRLKGKARRARAFEFMAVQSSQTSIPEDLV